MSNDRTKAREDRKRRRAFAHIAEERNERKIYCKKFECVTVQHIRFSLIEIYAVCFFFFGVNVCVCVCVVHPIELSVRQKMLDSMAHGTPLRRSINKLISSSESYCHCLRRQLFFFRC